MIVREYRSGRALCMCGCGEPAPIAKRSATAYGWVKGRPKCYIRGHQTRKRLRYVVDPETGCWNWLLCVDPNGYGRINHRPGKTGLAHRDLYALHKGPIPDGLEIDHLCRNPRCVNPEHLEAVTPAENTRRGVRTKLTVADVLVIRAARFRVSQRKLAARFGVGHTTVGAIQRGEKWKNPL